MHRGFAIGLFVVACTPAAAPTAAPPVPEQRAAPDEPAAHGTVYIGVRTSVGTERGDATRGVLVLTLDGSSATLVETTQTASAALDLAHADREAKWTTTDTHVDKGPMRVVGDRTELDLDNASGALDLRCWHRPLAVAAAGARRVHTPGRAHDCTDPGVWQPATLTIIDALVCGFGDQLDLGQREGLDGRMGSLDETLWRFAPAPGVEYVEQEDSCFSSTGLRVGPRSR